MVVLVAEPQLAPFRVDVAILQVLDQVGGGNENVVQHQPSDDRFPEVVIVCGARRVKIQRRPHHGCVLALPETGTPTGRQRGMHFMMAS